MRFLLPGRRLQGRPADGGAGRFSVFGVGGLSHIDLLGDLKDTTNFYNNPYQDIHQKTGMGAAGISHTYFWNNTSYTKLTLAATGMQSRVSLDSLDSERRKHVQFRDDSWQTRYSLNFQWNKKINARNSLNLGATANLLDAQLRDSTRVESDLLGVSRQFEGKTSLFQINGHWQHRVGENFTLNLGLYSQSLSLNSSVSIEPRMNLRYALDRRQTLSLGLGRHSQMQPLGVYFNQAAGEPVQPNRSLDFTYSNQAVLGYELRFAADWRLQVETYYQAISNVPVDAQPTSFSMLNTGADFGLTDRIGLVNKGTGKNYGMECTIERTFSNGYLLHCFALSKPVQGQRWSGSTNSLFNGGCVANLLAGREFAIGKKTVLALDTRLSAAGGKRDTPLDHRAICITAPGRVSGGPGLFASIKELFRADFKVTLRLNGRRNMQEWFVDLQNLTGQKNVFSRQYDPQQNVVRSNVSARLFPQLQLPDSILNTLREHGYYPVHLARGAAFVRPPLRTGNRKGHCILPRYGQFGGH